MAFILEESQEQPKESLGRFVLEEPTTKKPEEETWGQYAGRQVARTGSRALETIAGMPGDIVQTVKYIGSKLPESPKFLRGEETFVSKGLRKAVEKLPTSKEMKDFTTSIIGDYIKPQTKGEEFSDEVVSDMTSLLVGRKFPTEGGIITKTLKTIAKPFLVSLGANVVKEGIELGGGKEKAQTYGKLGTMFMLDLVGRPSARSLKNELYKDSDSLLTKDASVSAKKLNIRLDNLEKELTKGGTSPSKAPVLTKIQETRVKIKDGKIPIESLTELKKDLNDVSSILYDLPKDVKNNLKRNFNELRNSLKETIYEYGEQNPKFVDTWKKAEEVDGAIKQSAKAKNFIINSFKKHPHLSTTISGAVLVPLGLTVGAKGLLMAPPAAIANYGAELGYRILKSPTLRKHYLNTIKSAIKEETPAVIKNISALDKEMKKQGFTLED